MAASSIDQHSRNLNHAAGLRVGPGLWLRGDWWGGPGPCTRGTWASTTCALPLRKARLTVGNLAEDLVHIQISGIAMASGDGNDCQSLCVVCPAIAAVSRTIALRTAGEAIRLKAPFNSWPSPLAINWASSPSINVFSNRVPFV